MSRAGRGRALEREAFLARRRGVVEPAALETALARLLDEPDGTIRGGPRGFADSDTRRWVPIGPSVVRRGLGNNRPRVTGRVRDLAVSDDGRRLYAATAKGGVWYSGDGGGTWDPVGGWAQRVRRSGGSNTAQSCGCLLVRFGADTASDVVLVGTGEPSPRLLPFGGTSGGVGVLAARGPAGAAVGGDPWEPTTGLSVLEGHGIYRLARDPASTPFDTTGTAQDRVLAATTDGLFLGTRQALTDHDPDADPAAPGPGGDGYAWARVAGYDALTAPQWPATDVVWLPGGRILVASAWNGVALSDDGGGSFSWVTGLAAGTVRGRMSLAVVGGARVYALGERPPASRSGAGRPTLWRFPATGAAPSATRIGGVPQNLWGAQRDYDQAIAVDADGARDRIYLGGSTVQPTSTSVWSASLWCFTASATAASPTLAPADGVSRTGAPPGGDGADRAGLIGNDVHADVHALRLTGPPGSRQLWVGCDGGVFVSTRAGRCNSFAARVTGLAALEIGFAATHPVSSQFLAIGSQDNGSHVRAGDTVWDTLTDADAGGTAIHPTQWHRVVAQYTDAAWYAQPTAGYRDPMQRGTGGPSNFSTIGRESDRSLFYSGAASVRTAPPAGTPPAGRIALGTNRVWFTDDLGGGAANTWRVLPKPPGGAASDPRPGGGDPVAKRTVGVPPGSLGAVVTVKWASPTELYALYERGLVHYDQTGPNAWTTTVLLPAPTVAGAPSVGGTLLTDVAAVPGTSAYYLVTLGAPANPATDTVWYCDRTAPGTFLATGLRRRLDLPGTPPTPGPLDAAFAAVVDPGDISVVYVGTATGAWRGERHTDPSGAVRHDWTPFVNGLPHATVQDLTVWTDGTRRLLRAAVQSRGVWEVDLVADEPPRTYVRVHEHDDRRVLPVPLASPRRAPGGPDLPATSSPDLVVRPAWPWTPPPTAAGAAAPAWQVGNGRIKAGSAPPYELWTFQTAFRWLYPSVVANGEWSDQFGDVVALHRAADPALDNGRFIDRTMWNAVVAGVRLDGTGTVTSTPTDPLAVYRPAWQHPAALVAAATEVDLVELVRPPRVTADVWQVYRERSTVDVLLHHRDTRPLPVDDAWVVLLWATDPSPATLLALGVADVPAYAAAVAAGSAPASPPAGWTPLAGSAGGLCSRLPVTLDARIPRAVSVPLDLSTVPVNNAVLLLTVVGSSSETATRPAPVGTPAGAVDLVRGWPYAAARLLTVVDRPA